MQILDWGQVTTEGSNLNSNEFIYVYNHDLTTSEKVDRTIRFIIGRLYYYDLHLPKDSKHNINIDIRGQQVSGTTCDFIIYEIKNKYSRPGFLTINFVKN